MGMTRCIIRLKGSDTPYVLLHHNEAKGVVRLCEMGANPDEEWFKQPEDNVGEVLDDPLPARYMGSSRETSSGETRSGKTKKIETESCEIRGFRGWVAQCELSRMFVKGSKPDPLTGTITSRPTYVRRLFLYNGMGQLTLEFTLTSRRPIWTDEQKDECLQAARDLCGASAWDNLGLDDAGFYNPDRALEERMNLAKKHWRSISPDPVVSVKDKRDDESMSRAAFTEMVWRYFATGNYELDVVEQNRARAKVDEIFNFLRC